MRSRAELVHHLDSEGQSVLMLSYLMQDLIDFDAFLGREDGHGYGLIQEFVFHQLGVSAADRGLYIRMAVSLDMALDEGNGALKKLDIKVADRAGSECMVYGEKRAVVPLIVAEVDDLNVQYWLRLPSVEAQKPAEQRFVYHLGSRGVDGLLEYLGLGNFGVSEKFGLVENIRHWLECNELAGRGIDLWWVDGDRRSFVRIESGEGPDYPMATHFFQLGGGYWGRRVVSFEEAALLGMKTGRQVDPEQIRFEEL